MCCITDALHTNLLHVVLRLVVPSPRLVQALRLIELLHHILPVVPQGLDPLAVVLNLALQSVYLRFFPVDLPQNKRKHTNASHTGPTHH